MTRPIRLTARRTGRLTQLGPPGADPLPAAVIRAATLAPAGDELTRHEALELLGALDAEPVPEWWPPLFARRQRRLRTRILRQLRTLDDEHSTYQVCQRCPGYDEPEIEHALCTLASGGLVIADRRRTPVRHGGAERREWTYWRLA